jgi:hypothetical protein
MPKHILLILVALFSGSWLQSLSGLLSMLDGRLAGTMVSQTTPFHPGNADMKSVAITKFASNPAI